MSGGFLQGARGEDLRLLAVREVTGRIEAILSWVGPGPILLDGLRAVPCRSLEGRLAELPLTIPLAPGRYGLQIEPVVESRFWASDRGYTALTWEPKETRTARWCSNAPLRIASTS
jgi:hypothetical protein